MIMKMYKICWLSGHQESSAITNRQPFFAVVTISFSFALFPDCILVVIKLKWDDLPKTNKWTRNNPNETLNALIFDDINWPETVITQWIHGFLSVLS